MDGPAPVFFCNALFDEEPEPGHFLGSCFLCDKPLPCNRDIFMYRGDTPFCSEECRQEQIDIDEAMQMKKQKQKQGKLSASRKKRLSSSVTKTEQHTKTHDVHVSAAGTSVAG